MTSKATSPQASKHCGRTYSIGDRVSFDSSICTVRYCGLIKGTGDKLWVGVEWDDSKRGKHDGMHNGIRYFSCISKSPTAASFIAATKPCDPVRSFVQAVHEKYAPDVQSGISPTPLDDLIEISGKVVEKIGFEKIRRQQAELQELKIVLVDGFRITAATTDIPVRDTCSKVTELDLSRNLFISLEPILDICEELPSLRRLRLNGNRFFEEGRHASHQIQRCNSALEFVYDLELDETLLSWVNLCSIAKNIPSLKKLSASSNEIESLFCPFIWSGNLTSLTLEYNKFASLGDLQSLKGLHSLQSLHLKGNKIASISTAKSVESTVLRYIDLSYNQISDWGFVDDLPIVFPQMTELRISKNPLYGPLTDDAVEESFMVTLARLGNLKVLNFSTITPQERTNAELLYLSKIGKEMMEVSEEEEGTVISRHKRYTELCDQHGEPAIVRKSNKTLDPDFVEARLIKFTFTLPPGQLDGQHEAIVKIKEIPRSWNIWQVKGIVLRAFNLKVHTIKLIWETYESIPIADVDDLEDDSDEEPLRIEEVRTKREEVIKSSTRPIGNIVDGREVNVRVELTDGY